MRRLLIFGNSGSGKTTLARELVENSDLVHLDLDLLAWKPGMPPARVPLDESERLILEFVEDNGDWVIEGCYADLLEMAIPFATEVIFMNLGAEACKENALERPWEPHKYESKEAQDANLDMLLRWIEEYYVRDGIMSHKAHMALYESFEDTKSMRTENRAAPEGQ